MHLAPYSHGQGDGPAFVPSPGTFAHKQTFTAISVSSWYLHSLILTCSPGPPGFLTISLVLVVGDWEGVHGLLPSDLRLPLSSRVSRTLSLAGVRKGRDVAELAGPIGRAEAFVLLETDSPILADEGTQDCGTERTYEWEQREKLSSPKLTGFSVEMQARDCNTRQPAFVFHPHPGQ